MLGLRLILLYPEPRGKSSRLGDLQALLTAYTYRFPAQYRENLEIPEGFRWLTFRHFQGNVYDMSSLQMLAIKTKTMRDLVTEEPFTRKDIITIQACPSHFHILAGWADKMTTGSGEPGSARPQEL